MFWGITMLLLNLGSRFIVADLGKFHETILANEYFKKLILFSMFFVATRDILAAFVLTILYIIVIDGLLHEKRKFCIIPKKYMENIQKQDQNKLEINETQYLQAKQVVLAYETDKKNTQEINQEINQENTQGQITQGQIIPIKTSYEKYIDNVKLLNIV